MSREEAEKDLNFVGFLIYESPLKGDTKKYIDQIREAGYKMIMITGDNVLTAANVSS